MSMYNMIHGTGNTDLAAIISSIRNDFLPGLIPRYRDIFLNDDNSPIKDYDYLIYTRMGGGNYECWDFGYDKCNDGNGDEVCPYHELLKIESDDRYLGGYNDDFDCTYRTLAFKFTDKEKEMWNGFISKDKDTIKKLDERWKKLVTIEKENEVEEDE